MARVSKEYNVRKNEIMDTAQILFYSKGYDAVSVNLIIETIGISKGTFYHYFKSKEELLDQLVLRFTQAAITHIQPVMEDHSINAIEKLNLLYKRSSKFKLDQADFIKTIINVFYDDNNIVMRYKFRNKNLELFVPYFATIFEQGIQEGVFKMGDPTKTAELVMIMATSLADKTSVLLRDSAKNPSNKDEFILYLKTYRQCIEKIIGAPDNSIVLFDETELLEFFKWYEL
ncbi:TetR/AcrR family transcriptional regulator [Candidatus Cloacimonadota bacterium]